MPYIEEAVLEEDVRKLISQQVRLSEEDVEIGGKLAHTQLDQELSNDAKLAEQATRRIKQLERDRQKLIDTLLAGTLADEDVKLRREEISREIANLKARLADYGRDAERLHKRLNEVIAMAHNASQLYKLAGGTAEQHLLRTLFFGDSGGIKRRKGASSYLKQGRNDPCF